MLKKILLFLDSSFEKNVCVALMSALALLLGVQVFMRYVMQSSLGWSEELARYIFVWLVYISISYGSQLMRHIKIDAGLFLFPKFLRPWIVLLAEIAFMVFAAIIAYYALKLVQRQMMIGSASTALNIPMWIVYSAPFVGMSLTAFRQLQAVIWRLKHWNHSPEEVAAQDAGKAVTGGND